MSLHQKQVTVGFIFLLLVTTTVPVTLSVQTVESNIIRVDDEPGDADYTTITEALQHTQPGDTIEVYSGTYYENEIHVGARGLTLLGVPYERGNGNDTGKPVVTSSANFTTIFYVPGNSITLTGFVIHDGSAPGKETCPVKIWGDNCTFSSNIIVGGRIALNIGTVYHSPIDTRIIGNTIESTRAGIVYAGQHGNISGNTISGCTKSGIVMNDGGAFNIICRNTIQNCDDTGIEFYNNPESIISYNLIFDTPRGIFLGAEGAKNISITMNMFQRCGMGICMEFLQSLIEVQQNNFIDNSVDIRIIQHLQGTNNFLFHRILDGNYYDSWRGSGPKRIWGVTVIFVIPILMLELFALIPILIPRIYRDWHPAQEPYDIGG